MTLRPDVDRLIQGGLDGTLPSGERETLERLIATDAEARGRVADLNQLSEMLQSLGSAEPPATLVQDVLARISQSPVRRSIYSPSVSIRPSAPRGDIGMNKKIVWGLALAAVLVIVVMRLAGYPPVSEGTEATIGTAQRYQAPQIQAKDVAVGDTSVQALMQTETWDAIMKDETLRTLLQDANLRASLQDPELRLALAHTDILRALRGPALGRQLTDAALLRALEDPELAAKLNNPGLTKKLLGDPGLARSLNDENLRAALRNQVFVNALRNSEFRTQLVRANVAAALAGPAFQMALKDNGFAKALSHARFAEAMGIDTSPSRR